MKALVFCDDIYHPAATVRAGLAPLTTGHGFDFDWVEDATGWVPSTLEAYPVALLSKSNVRSQKDHTPWLTGAAEEIFRAHVRRGGGLVVVHSGTASYRDVAPVRAVTGGAFVSHPPPCQVTLAPRTPHPLTEGVAEPFTIFDEHYQMLMDDPRPDVFLHSHSVHGIQPAGWTRQEGEGRVAVLTPGHLVDVWLHPSFQRLLANALHWVSVGR